MWIRRVGADHRKPRSAGTATRMRLETRSYSPIQTAWTSSTENMIGVHQHRNPRPVDLHPSRPRQQGPHRLRSPRQQHAGQLDPTQRLHLPRRPPASHRVRRWHKEILQPRPPRHPARADQQGGWHRQGLSHLWDRSTRYSIWIQSWSHEFQCLELCVRHW